jgi:hypothetical protein
MAKLKSDEEDANRLGISHRFMHLSALSPSTRRSHAERSGNLYTAGEIRVWMAEGDNAVGCKCAFTQVLVDRDGHPLSPGLVQRVVLARKSYLLKVNP